MRRFLVILLAMATLCSCRAVSGLIHDDVVVAKVGDEKLYLSELQQFVPQGVSAEDSVNLARQYINSWALELLYQKVADGSLSKEEKDVTAALEAYRRSLLKYRYEQSYLETRLDTLVTEAQTLEYYEAHKDIFTLKRPIVKFRFAEIASDSKDKSDVVSLMSSDRPSDRIILDSLAMTRLLKYVDSSTEWVDVVVLAEAFELDYTTLLSKMKDSKIEMTTENGTTRIAYVGAIVRSGVPPIDFCRSRINDIILSARKHALLTSLERDLLEDALGNKQFVIYE